MLAGTVLALPLEVVMKHQLINEMEIKVSKYNIKERERLIGARDPKKNVLLSTQRHSPSRGDRGDDEPETVVSDDVAEMGLFHELTSWVPCYTGLLVWGLLTPLASHLRRWCTCNVLWVVGMFSVAARVARMLQDRIKIRTIKLRVAHQLFGHPEAVTAFAEVPQVFIARG